MNTTLQGYVMGKYLRSISVSNTSNRAEIGNQSQPLGIEQAFRNIFNNPIEQRAQDNTIKVNS